MSSRSLRSAVILTAATAAVALTMVTPAAADAPECPEPKIVQPAGTSYFGTDCDEIINVLPSTTYVDTKGGNDIVYFSKGGSSASTVKLGDGDDQYYGKADGQTRVLAGKGNDKLVAAPEPFSLWSGALYGDDGNDTITAEDGSWMRGGNGDDTLTATGSSGCAKSVMNSWDIEFTDWVPAGVKWTDYCTVILGDDGTDKLIVTDHPGDATRKGAWLHGGAGNDVYGAAQPLSTTHRIDRIWEAAGQGSDTGYVNAKDILPQHLETKKVTN